MKLHDCIVTGKFCGLETVEECINNFELHIANLIPYTRLREESLELSKEYEDYLSGKLRLDWDKIYEEVEELDKGLMEEFQSEPEDKVQPIDIDFNSDKYWQYDD